MRVYCINSEDTELKLKEWYFVERVIGSFTTPDNHHFSERIIPGNEYQYDLEGFHRLFEASRFMTEEEFAQIRDTKIDNIIK